MCLDKMVGDKRRRRLDRRALAAAVCAPDAQAPKSWPLLPDHHSLFVLFVACTRTQCAPRYNHRTLARTQNLTTCGVGPEVGAALRSSGSTSCVAAGCYARRPHVSATTRSATLLEGRLPSRNQCRCCSAMIILRRISTRTLCRYYSRLRLRHHRHIRSRCASYELLCPPFDKLSLASSHLRSRIQFCLLCGQTELSLGLHITTFPSQDSTYCAFLARRPPREHRDGLSGQRDR